MNEPERRVPLVDVSDLLAPGAPLPFRVLDGYGRLLLATGQRIAGARQLSALMERGACVEWPEVERVRRERAAAAGGPAIDHAVRRETLFDRWEQFVWKLDTLLRALGRDAGQAAELEGLATQLVALVDREIDAALFIAMRQDDRRFALYGITHAMHTATVALLAARTLGWPVAAQRCLVLAALTMNAAIVELQGRMAEQDDPPTKKQIETLRAHPQASTDLLRASGVADADWLTAVEQHHERPGPGGYPLGVQATSDAAHLLRAADVFMAKVSPRALRAPMVPQQAARQLFQEEGGGPIAGALIKAIGVHPPGDLVKLKNGEAAIVVQRAVDGHATRVAALLDARGKVLAGAPRRDTAVADFAIAGPLLDRAGLPRVLPEQVYGLIEP